MYGLELVLTGSRTKLMGVVTEKLAENVRNVDARVAKACARSNREPDSVAVVANEPHILCAIDHEGCGGGGDEGEHCGATRVHTLILASRGRLGHS